MIFSYGKNVACEPIESKVSIPGAGRLFDEAAAVPLVKTKVKMSNGLLGIETGDFVWVRTNERAAWMTRLSIGDAIIILVPESEILLVTKDE